MIRKALQRWLGVTALEACVDALDASAASDDEAREQLERSVAGVRESLTTHGKRLDGYESRLEARLSQAFERYNLLDSRLKRLETPVSAPKQIERPVLCPFCGHSGLVIAAVETEVERTKPDQTAVVGYGFACGKCKRGFYWETGPDGGRTRAADATLDEGRPPGAQEAEPAPTTREMPRPRFRPQRRT